MISPQRSHKHYVISSGKLKQKVHQSQTPTPKTIHYTHKVRILTSFECDHEVQIAEINQRHSFQIQQKDNEIRKLLKIVSQNQSSLMNKENQIKRLHQKERKQIFKTQYSDSKNEISRIILKSNENIFVSNQIQKKQPKQLFHDVQTFGSNFEQKTDQQIQKVKQQIKNTFDALSNFTNLLQKPRRKYKFYFEDLQLKDHKKEVINSDKVLSQTTINQFQQDSMNQTFIQPIENEQTHNYQQQSLDLDPDQTSDEDCRDTQTFLQGLINEHRILRQTLIDLEQSTNKEIQDMKCHYQKEISMYIQLLKSEQQHNLKFQLNSDRTNYSSEENNQWDYYSNSEQDQNWPYQRCIQDKPVDDQRQYPPDY